MITTFSMGDLDLWHVVGWTMVHFLWLGTLLAVAVAGLRILLRRAPCEARYWATLFSFAVLALLPMAIASWLAINAPSATLLAIDPDLREEPTPFAPAASASDDIVEIGPRGLAPVPAINVESGASASARAPSAQQENAFASGRELFTATLSVIDACVPYLPWVWLIGTPATFALLATGVIGTKRLRRESRLVETGPVVDSLARLSKSLGVTRRVLVAVCQRIAAPVLVGIVRPMILLPPSALTGWSPDEIEMVLLHELAHVRRWDNAVNLAQWLVESLLFFHPAVWLVSNWVRREREACCDAVVVRHIERPRAYAELLVSLASEPSEPGRPRPRFFSRLKNRGRGRPGSLASAMAAGPLRSRIRRILNLEDDPMLISSKSLLVVLASLVMIAALALLYVPTPGRAEESTTEATESTETNGVEKRVEKAPGQTDDNPFGVEPNRQLADEDPFGAEDLFGEVDPQPADESPFDATRRNRKFPTLEEQKLADLAWKKLGLELEPIGQEDLEKAKALGYEGGVKVAVARGSTVDNYHEIQGGDILVGLHVWPTTSLGDVAEVLGRADLPTLNPLKFYVVRPRPTGVFGGADEDTVVTGRIEVAVPEPGEYGAVQHGQAVLPWEENEPPWVPLDERGGRRDRRGTYGETGSPRPGAEGARMVVHFFYSPDSLPSRRMKTIVDRTVNKFPDIRFVQIDVSKKPNEARAMDVDKVPTTVVVRDGEVVDRLIGLQTDEGFYEAIDAARKAWTESPIDEPSATQPRASGDKAAPNPVVRYEGKTFEEWAQVWRTELSTEQRLEAVKALAAFGAAGYSRQAAEQILAVAGQYAWASGYPRDLAKANSLQRLKATCVDAFSGDIETGTPRLPTDEALPVLLEHVDSKNEQIRLFLTHVLVAFKHDPRALEAMVKLSRDEHRTVRFHAFHDLRGFADAMENELVVQRVRDALQDEDTDLRRTAIRVLLSVSDRGEQRLHYIAELGSVLFAEDEWLRKAARDALRYIQPADARHIIAQLLEVLGSADRHADHIEAIRALAAMGPKAEPAADELRELLASDDESLRIAAAAALRLILGDESEFNLAIRDTIANALGVEIDEHGNITAYPGTQRPWSQFQAAIEQEHQRLFQ